MVKTQVDKIVGHLLNNFPSFGGGKKSDWNPITAALCDQPPMFAAGVDIRQVVETVIAQLEK